MTPSIWIEFKQLKDLPKATSLFYYAFNLNILIVYNFSTWLSNYKLLFFIILSNLITIT